MYPKMIDQISTCHDQIRAIVSTVECKHGHLSGPCVPPRSPSPSSDTQNFLPGACERIETRLADCPYMVGQGNWWLQRAPGRDQPTKLLIISVRVEGKEWRAGMAKGRRDRLSSQSRADPAAHRPYVANSQSASYVRASCRLRLSLPSPSGVSMIP